MGLGILKHFLRPKVMDWHLGLKMGSNLDLTKHLEMVKVMD